MKKTKKSAFVLPKTIQLTFISVAIAAYIIESIHWINILSRTYPNGLRLSQFSVMAIGTLLLPIILFATSFLAYKKNINKFDTLFNATLMTVIGLAIYVLVFTAEWKLLQNPNIIFESPWRPAISMIVAFALFIGLQLLIVKSSKRTSITKKIQMTTICIMGIVFIINTITNLWDLVSRHVGSIDIMNFFTHQQFVIAIILPLIFLVAAYFILPKTASKTNRLFTAVVYALTGVLTMNATIIATYLVLTLLPPSRSTALHIIEFQTIAAAILGVTIFSILLLTPAQSKVRLKKSR